MMPGSTRDGVLLVVETCQSGEPHIAEGADTDDADGPVQGQFVVGAIPLYCVRRRENDRGAVPDGPPDSQSGILRRRGVSRCGV